MSSIRPSNVSPPRSPQSSFGTSPTSSIGSNDSDSSGSRRSSSPTPDLEVLASHIHEFTPEYIQSKGNHWGFFLRGTSCSPGVISN